MQLSRDAIRGAFLSYYHGLLLPLERRESDLRRFTLRLLASMVAKIDNDHRIAHAERELIASHLKTRVLDPLVRGEYAHIVYDTRHVEQPIEHHDDDRFTDASSDIESDEWKR